jgi:hypothetical protein
MEGGGGVGGGKKGHQIINAIRKKICWIDFFSLFPPVLVAL